MYVVRTLGLWRDVSTGATGVTSAAPKFSDTLTLSPPSQRSHLNFSCGYVPAHYNSNLSQVDFIKKIDHRVENGDWLATHHTMGSALMNKDFAEDSREYEVDLRYHSYIT